MKSDPEPLAEELYDNEKVEKAVAMFEGQGLSAPEALLASTRLLTASLARFKKEAAAFRESVGEENTRRFATEEMNEIVYDIQDSAPVAVRIFNSLMRDPEQKGQPEL